MFSINRDCWFCSTSNSVSLFKLNSWTCSHCEQYNGFTADGDYNKSIPEMYINRNNYKYSSSATATSHAKNTTTNNLCEKCNRNQHTKLIKLSNYESKNESTYDFEIEMYKSYLDKLYDLCDLCKSRVRFEICKQDGIIKQYEYMLKLKDRNGGGRCSDSNIEEGEKSKRRSRWWPKTALNILLFTLIAYLVAIEYLNDDEVHASHGTIVYVLSYVISFALVLLNNFSIKSILITILIVIAMYSNHLNILNACLPLNLLVMLNLVLFRQQQKEEKREEPTKLLMRPMQSTNDQLSKILYNQNRLQATTAQQSMSFVKTATASNSSFHQIKSNFKVPPTPQTHSRANMGSISLIDFNYNHQNSLFNLKQQHQQTHKTGSCLLRPATLNLSSQQDNYNTDNNSSSDYSDDDSSSIISGMTNLYLEKSNGRSKKNSSSSLLLTRMNVEQHEKQNSIVMMNSKSNSIYMRGYNLVSILMAFTNASIVAIFLYRICLNTSLF